MRVLVVEDENKMAILLKRGLEEEGMAVDIANDGEHGYYSARIIPYDLIILDITLPGLSGLTVCQKLRLDGIVTPILMLTARDNLETKVQGLDFGADDYLTKPFAFAELLARIRALLRRNRKEVLMQLQIADLILDPNLHLVTRSGQEINLTTKEYALLECFMRHPNQVLSRSMLSEKVWDESFETFTNVVDVYINYLRNKIDRDFEPKLIHTIRGVGYIMKPPK
jgi:DNA-binding response OmpR family regulator